MNAAGAPASRSPYTINASTPVRRINSRASPHLRSRSANDNAGTDSMRTPFAEDIPLDHNSFI
ncbi:Uncharacterised protein [Mycobacteroides abscessus subsp. abscessus]|nr:Uncharacterised protein [Mycobacteroides abscessus subsp. abscessus]